MENKQLAFLNWAVSKQWDASLYVYNGKHMAILNPVNIQKTFEGESDVSSNEAIEKCKQEYLDHKNKDK